MLKISIESDNFSLWQRVVTVSTCYERCIDFSWLVKEHKCVAGNLRKYQLLQMKKKKKIQPKICSERFIFEMIRLMQCENATNAIPFKRNDVIPHTKNAVDIYIYTERVKKVGVKEMNMNCSH